MSSSYARPEFHGRPIRFVHTRPWRRMPFFFMFSGALAAILVLVVLAIANAPTPPGPGAFVPWAAVLVAFVLYFLVPFILRDPLSTPMVVAEGRLRLRCRIQPDLITGLLYDPPWKTFTLSEIEGVAMEDVMAPVFGVKHLRVRTKQGGAYWFDQEELALYENEDGEGLNDWLIRQFTKAPQREGAPRVN